VQGTGFDARQFTRKAVVFSGKTQSKGGGPPQDLEEAKRKGGKKVAGWVKVGGGGVCITKGGGGLERQNKLGEPEPPGVEEKKETLLPTPRGGWPPKYNPGRKRTVTVPGRNDWRLKTKKRDVGNEGGRWRGAD